MGGNTGQSGADPFVGSLSFVPGLLANFFLGTGLAPNQGGFQSVGADNQFNVLGAGGQGDPQALLSNLLDLGDPNINQGVPGAQSFLNFGQQGAAGAAGVGLGALDTLSEGLETGFKPDLQPIIEAEQRRFFDEIVPGIQQQNVFANEGGVFGSDVTGQLFNAGKDLSVELGSLETGLQQQAGQTRANLTGLSGNILNQLQNLPFEAGFNTLNLGEQLVLQGTAGGRQAQLLQLLSGVDPAQPVSGQTSSSKSKGGGVFSG